MDITITLKVDEELGGNPDHMARAILALQDLGIVPAEKVVLKLKCLPGREKDLMATIDNALCNVPDQIDVTIKTVSERGVQRVKAANTPIEQAIRDRPPDEPRTPFDEMPGRERDDDDE